MSYEVVTDLNYTPVLASANDKYKWANAGPGAKRGLNRIFGRDIKTPLKNEQSNYEMMDLLDYSVTMLPPHVPALEMRDIEHSLCEFDKYERTRLNQGRPRAKYHRPV